MANTFLGSALPLDAAGLQKSLDALAVDASQLWAVLQVETSGRGFQPDRRPAILFERHVFSERTAGRFDRTNPDLSNSVPGGYGATGDHQYDRLDAAINLDRKAALESTSWGIGQVMGFNAGAVGYAGVEDMVDAMIASEALQLLAMAAFVKSKKLDGPLRTNDWTRFASGYNGPDYRINNYDTRLASANDAMSRGALPDLDIREGQMLLGYLNFDPRGVDGVMGKFTRSAMNQFQTAQGLALTQSFDAATLAALRDRFAALG